MRESPLEGGIFTLRRIVAALFCLTIYFVVGNFQLHYLVAVWFGFLIGQALFFRRSRFGIFLYFTLSLYGTAAYIAWLIGHQIFPPWPSQTVIERSTEQALMSVILATGLCELLIGSEAIGFMLRTASVRVEQLVTRVRSGVVDVFLSLGLIIVGAADAFRIAEVGFGAVAGGYRREFANRLLLAGDHNLQLVCIAATIVLVARRYFLTTGILPILAVTIGWLPYIVVGSRKELVTTAAICVVLLGHKFTGRQRIVIAAGGVSVFALPWLLSGDVYSSLHEFILPQYMQFSIDMGLVPGDLVGSFIERAQFLLPAPLRLTQIVGFGQAFFELRLTGVGIGASPFGEAILVAGAGQSAVWFFAGLFVVWVIFMRLMAERMYVVTVVSYGLLLVYGRSDFWTMAFFAIYISLLLWLLSVLPVDPSVFPVRDRAMTARAQSAAPVVNQHIRGAGPQFGTSPGRAPDGPSDPGPRTSATNVAPPIGRTRRI
jgi:hypothetical protein